MRPDLEIKWIRGNIETRINKLETEDYDAIILAAAGLSRMGWKADIATEFLDPTNCLPAIGQGALGIECRADDMELLEHLSKLTSDVTARAVEAERIFLHEMEGSCQVPIAGFGTILDDNQIELTALVASPDGKIVYKETVTGWEPRLVGEEASKLLIDQGAKKID